MPKFLMIAQSAPVEGREQEFNDWYQNTHLPDVVAIAGFMRAQRYEVGAHISGTEPLPYLTVYEIEAESAESARQALIDAAMAGKTPVSDVLDRSLMTTTIFSPCDQAVSKNV